MSDLIELDNFGISWPREAIGSLVGADGKVWRVVGLKDFGRTLVVEPYEQENA